MKKIYIILSTLFLFIFHVSGDIKIDKIAVINLEKVMDTVFSGNSGVIQNIKKEKEEMQKKLDKIKENINKLEEFKLKEKDTSRKLIYQKKIDDQKKEYSNYYKIKNYQIEKKQKNALGSVLNEIRQAVKKVAEKDGYTLVLDINTDGIFYYTIDIDITEKVIEFFTKRYGEEEEVEEE